MTTANATPAPAKAPAPKKDAKGNGVLSTLANNSKQYGIVGALIVIVLVFQFLTDGVLLKPNSFVSLIQQNAYVIILAIGMVMVIIATHIDLSVGSIVAFVGGVCAILMERQGVNWMLAILISLLVGLVIGCWQGFWVAYVGIPGFITTLAGMLIFRGLATVIVGESVPVTSPEFRGIARNYLPNILGWWGPFDGLTIVVGIICIALYAWSLLRRRAKVAKAGLNPEPMALTVTKIVIATLLIGFVTYLLALSGNATQGGIPIMLVILAVLVFIYNFILTKTVFGRHVYAVGGNRKAAILQASTRSASISHSSCIWASFQQWQPSACSPVSPRQPHKPAWSSRWMRSQPASSAARQSPAASAPFPAQWLAHSSWALSTAPVDHGRRHRNRQDDQRPRAPRCGCRRHHDEAQEELMPIWVGAGKSFRPHPNQPNSSFLPSSPSSGTLAINLSVGGRRPSFPRQQHFTATQLRGAP